MGLLDREMRHLRMGVRILLGISGGADNRSKRELAFSIAKKTGSAISALAIQDVERLKQLDQKTLGVYSHQVKKVERRLERAESLIEARIAKLEEKAKAKKIDLTAISAEGDMLEAGMNEWRFHDLLVMSARPWMIGVDRPEDSSIILKLIAGGVRPVLAVPKGAPAAVSKVLIALSGSIDSAKAMKHLVQLNIFPGASMHLVTVGPPKDLSMMTLRPVGPIVTATALASLSTPRSTLARAWSSNSSCLATLVVPYFRGSLQQRPSLRPRNAVFE